MIRLTAEANPPAAYVTLKGMEVLKKDLPGCLLGRVGLAIGFILLQTKQTNSELGHQDPMLKDLILSLGLRKHTQI